MPLSVPRWTERLLFAIGFVCLGIWLYAFVDTKLSGMREEKRLEEALRQQASKPAPPAAETDSLASFQEKKSPGGLKDEKDERDKKDELAAAHQEGETLEEGDLIGRIEIPRVGVSAIVLHGVGKKTLRRGVGHIPGTPLPIQEGNVGLAGHRDSFFRELKDIREKDRIELTTLDGTFEYQVEWTKIVRPQDTYVLEDEGDPSLTLVTCYPFYYVGSAPKRFIVRARRIDETQPSS